MYKDITTYSRNEKEKKPRVLENNSNGVKFKVHKHIYYGNEWLLSCDELDIDKRDLNTEDIEEAKEKAIIEMVISLGKVIQKYEKAIKEISK